MPIRYKLVQRRDFSRDAEEGSKLYYATLVTSGSVEFEELCESISEETALTSADVKSCLDRLPRVIARHLAGGRNVKVGELGSFRFALSSKGAKTEEEFVAATMMKVPSLVFTPGRVFQDAREDATYIRVKPKDENGQTTTEPEDPDDGGSPGTV